MICTNCGHQNTDDVKFCIKCGQPIQASVPPGAVQMPLKRKKGLAIAISALAAALAIVILVLILLANPVVGRWYSKNGTELIMLKNGKGMTVKNDTDESQRVHFMYAIEYREPGYVEGEIYEKENGASTWFYLYDDSLEVNGEYFYRQKPTEPK